MHAAILTSGRMYHSIVEMYSLLVRIDIQVAEYSIQTPADLLTSRDQYAWPLHLLKVAAKCAVRIESSIQGMTNTISVEPNGTTVQLLV